MYLLTADKLHIGYSSGSDISKWEAGLELADLVVLQENPNAIPEGETPHAVTMLCFDEMVDTSKPGDRVTVTGIYKAVPIRVNPRHRALKSVYKTHIDILHVMRDEKSKLFSVSTESQEITETQDIDEPLIPVSQNRTPLSSHIHSTAPN